MTATIQRQETSSQSIQRHRSSTVLSRWRRNEHGTGTRFMLSNARHSHKCSSGLIYTRNANSPAVQVTTSIYQSTRMTEMTLFEWVQHSSFKQRFCPSINKNPSMPCIYHQKKEEWTPDNKQRQSQHDPPSISRFMNIGTWLMHFRTLDSHIIHIAKRQESSVRFRPRLDFHLTTCCRLSFAYSFHHKATILELDVIQTYQPHERTYYHG